MSPCPTRSNNRVLLDTVLTQIIKAFNGVELSTVIVRANVSFKLRHLTEKSLLITRPMDLTALPWMGSSIKLLLTVKDEKSVLCKSRSAKYAISRNLAKSLNHRHLCPFNINSQLHLIKMNSALILQLKDLESRKSVSLLE